MKNEIKQTPIEPIVASLARPLSSRLGQAVDILVFNPPYVPTSDDEVDTAQHGAGIAGSWAGGADGMQVTDTLLRQVDVSVCIFLRQRPVFSHALVMYPQGLLSPRGRFYLVAVKQNNVPKVEEFMSEAFALQSEVTSHFRLRS